MINIKKVKGGNMKKIILLMTVMFFLVAFISGEIQTLEPIAQGKCITLRQECSNCSWSNVTTINYPNGSSIFVNLAMIKSGSSYSSSFCSTLQLGTYSYCTLSDVDGIPTIVCVAFEVSTTGRTEGNILIPSFLLLVWVVLLGFALWKRNEYLGLFSSFCILAAGVYMMIYGFGSFADDYTRILSYVCLGLGIAFGFISMIEMFHDGEENNSDE